MKAAVYPFGQVLRGLRKQAGVSIFKARDLTRYKNYERWESGQTRVGADHLDNIAGAFGVGDDLWLLVYAWLVDRFTPLPGFQPVELTDAELRRHLDSLPKDTVDLGEHSNFALGPLSHRDLALIALTARYGRGYAGADRSLVLAPQERATMPASKPPDVSLLSFLFGDVERDVGEYVARTFILAGLGGLRGKPQRQVNRYSLLLLSDPEYLGRLLAAGAPPHNARARGLNRLARLAARLAPRLQRMASRQLEELRRQEEAVRGEPVTLDEVKAMIRQAASDDGLWESPAPDAAAVVDRPVLPSPNSPLNRQLRALHDQVDRTARRALMEELDDARATAAPRSAFDAIHVLEADTTDR